MTTGVKAVDQLIEKFGILSSPGQDKFQRLTHLFGGDKRADSLPFCMYQKVMGAPVSRRFTVHHFYLPYKNCKLASFMFNEKGELIEQVYFTKMSRMVNVCRKLQRMLLQERVLQGRQQQGRLQQESEWVHTEQFAA
ncbi:hypothetical protein [Alteromonas lipotrueae]|uniref:hypothetical protein n=1 Tax=Alteromonas lipotrueae TaxID=2803814 RepID=UPI001C44D019|nr:hypothetical protein [Alteromonas lipotrueae]